MGIAYNISKPDNDSGKEKKEYATPLAMGCIYIGGCPKILDEHIENIVIGKNNNNLILRKYSNDILSIQLCVI